MREARALTVRFAGRVLLLATLLGVVRPTLGAAEVCGAVWPGFAVALRGRAPKSYHPASPAGATEFRISDGDLEASVRCLPGGEWQLDVTASEQPLASIWFPWDPGPVALGGPAEDEVIYYPTFLGVAISATSLPEDVWQGPADYPGYCFAPLVVAADRTAARLVAAANWPPRRVRPLYARGRLALRYDEEIAPHEHRSYRALVDRVHVGPDADTQPWQLALDRYKSWLRARVHDAGLEPAHPAWLLAAHGWLNVQLQNMNRWDPDVVRRRWRTWGDRLPWVQFWGQMSDVFRPGLLSGLLSRERTGCCLDEPRMHPRYEPTLVELAATIARDGHVGYYVRPREGSGPLDESGQANPDRDFLRRWLALARDGYKANAVYVDVIGHRDFGEPLAVARLIGDALGPGAVIEYGVDVYPAAFLMSGSLNGGAWQGGPGRSVARFGAGLTRATAPEFGRYLFDDRVVFMGECNGDGRFWGPANDYWTERQAFLLGAKFDVVHPFEDELVGTENRALALAIAARARIGWWARRPVYRDRIGVRDVPAGVDVRRFRGKDGENLLVIDNWGRRRGQTLTVDGATLPISDEQLSIVVREASEPATEAHAGRNGRG
jgi:hypothetical protein